MSKRRDEARRAESLPTEQRDGQEVAGTNAAHCDAGSTSDSSIDSRQYEAVRQAKARRWLAYGINWRRENGPAWAAFEAYARECIREDKLLSGNTLSSIVADHEFTNTRTGKTTQLNRTALPLFARWLLREHPDLRAETRRSMFDLLFRDEEPDGGADDE